MKTTGNTILITGGSAGIGFEIARLFSQKGNQVIITGRDEARLKKAAASLPNITPIISDVSKEADVKKLVTQLKDEFPKLNVIINNAGRALVYSLADNNANSYENAADEILTNYLSVIRLNEQLLPLLKQQPEAAIVNVSSIVAFVPGINIPTYSSSKAALHSYTQSLRLSLDKTSNVKVFELMPPLVNTDFSQDIGGSNGIPPHVVADDLLAAFEKDNYEIHVGQTAEMYKFHHADPAGAFAAMNSVR